MVRRLRKKFLIFEKMKLPTFEEEILILEKQATGLLETARQLPLGIKRNDLLKEIGRFRVRIAALRKSEPSPSSN
jgi:hypothetical protein